MNYKKLFLDIEKQVEDFRIEISSKVHELPNHPGTTVLSKEPHCITVKSSEVFQEQRLDSEYYSFQYQYQMFLDWVINGKDILAIYRKIEEFLRTGTIIIASKTKFKCHPEVVENIRGIFSE